VIRFKQHFGLFDREDAATSYIFDSATLLSGLGMRSTA